MSNNEMPKAYDPHQVEERLYKWWEERGYFQPVVDFTKKPFVISIPPPNITGELHHGHAMFLAFEDLMIRWHRMLGDPTLWVPGTDHAGIATQNVVERELEKQGIKRRELGREEFVKRVWEWREEYGGIITHQIRRMGASCDWQRERFTLDEGLSRAVREAFVRLYEKGLIYRGPRLVNWCPHDESAISDLEVDHEETMGKLYYVRYRLAPDGNSSNVEHITVATTRPETILGDTAVAVHPRDKRYKKLVGRMAILPALGREIPIIADNAVDPKFGTGAVKVTPGHDPTDYDIGARHKLSIINIMNPNATINQNGGPYAGLDRYDARKKLVDDLQRDGQLEKIESHKMSIGRCQRCDTVVEPLISTQWFVKIAPLAKPAIAAVKSGKIKIVPTRFSKIYFNWMENIRDWCISRQLWWGHRIPVWYCENGHQTCTLADPNQCAVCGSKNIRQDEDVLDTWFSSGLWPFSTLGWPGETQDLKYFYPTSVLETGYDILFFWVARMIMLGLECTGKPPFHTVYLHGLMRDEKGEKMSKSKGNTANPLDVVRYYSADALRFTIVTGSAPGADMKLFPEKLENARNFGNKIWNMARFVVSNLDSRSLHASMSALRSRSLADRWIISRLNRLIGNVSGNYAKWNFGEGSRQIYEFLWSELADWYIEAAKISLYGSDGSAQARTRAILVHTLEKAMRLLHPTMPFVTEEVWQHLRRATTDGSSGDFVGPDAEQSNWPESLMIAAWPRADKELIDAHAEREFGLVMEIVRSIRNARAEFHVEAGKRIPAVISAGKSRALLESQRDLIASLARLEPVDLKIHLHADKPPQSLALVAGNLQVYLPLGGMIDLEKEKARLTNEMDKARADITRSKSLLKSEFTKRAPKQVVQKTRNQLTANEERLGKLDALLASIDGRSVTPVKNAAPTAAKSAKRTQAVKRTPAKKTKRK
jgi:valyl-tRNA synthetase